MSNPAKRISASTTSGNAASAIECWLAARSTDCEGSTQCVALRAKCSRRAGGGSCLDRSIAGLSYAALLMPWPRLKRAGGSRRRRQRKPSPSSPTPRPAKYAVSSIATSTRSKAFRTAPRRRARIASCRPRCCRRGPARATRRRTARARRRPSLPEGSAVAGEDCLVLNVFTPAVGDRQKRPVMVWLHGGGFRAGTGSAPLFDGTNLAHAHDVVVVTLNHRLNVFGFTYLAEAAGADFALSGAVGMLDIVAALQWVRDNIERFGGDPNLVTIFGQSGGGRKVATLMSMPSAKGLSIARSSRAAPCCGSPRTRTPTRHRTAARGARH